MLRDLPTAHRALPIGRRLAGQGCDGTSHLVVPPCSRSRAFAERPSRVRFVYFPVPDENDRRASYHQHLVMAEVLLDRMLAARAAGLRPMAPALDYAAEARAKVQPPRDLFHAATLEYRRWYADDGDVRPQPLTQEALTAQLVAEGLSIEQARDRAIHHSNALPAADQAWLIDRRDTPLAHRPLNQLEFRALITAIEGAWQAPASASHLTQANRQIALRVAAMLGNLLDEYTTSPFSIAALNDAFSERHLAHLRRNIEASRVAETASGVLLAGPKAWFAAKAARMRAEHQVGLAMSPATCQAMHLSGRPVVAVVGGKLRTFVDGWSRGRISSSVAYAAGKAASVA